MRALRGILTALVLVCLGAGVSRAQAPAPRPDRQVELLIFGPGDDVFGRYGHAGIRVVGPGTADRVFNFGITDWTKPNYIQDFLTGRVRFWGNAKPWERSRQSYVKWDRTILRYPLALAPPEVDRIVSRMEHDVEPEHREYVYDTFRDNCATRLRDYIDDATGGAVRRSVENEPLGPSYREDVRVAFAAFPSLLILTEIIPGLPLDAPRTTWERMYLPSVLGEAMTRVTLTRDGRTVPLTGQPIVDRVRTGPEPLTGWPDLGQAILCGVALLLAGAGVALRRATPRRRARVALVWWSVAALTTTVLTVVAVGTIWPDMQENWLLLALPPTDLLLAWPLVRVARGRSVPAARLVRGYLLVRVVTTLVLTGLAPAVALFAGPVPPRLAALAGLWLFALALETPAERPPEPA